MEILFTDGRRWYGILRLVLPGAFAGQEGLHQVGHVGPGRGFVEAKALRFVIGAPISAEQDIHEGGEVGIVTSLTVAVMVPVVEFRGAQRHTEWADREADIG